MYNINMSGITAASEALGHSIGSFIIDISPIFESIDRMNDQLVKVIQANRKVIDDLLEVIHRLAEKLREYLESFLDQIVISIETNYALTRVIDANSYEDLSVNTPPNGPPFVTTVEIQILIFLIWADDKAIPFIIKAFASFLLSRLFNAAF